MSLDSSEMASGDVEAALASRWSGKDGVPAPVVLATSEELSLTSLADLVVMDVDGALMEGSQVWLSSVEGRA
jgi:hypothetical protein